MKLMDIHTIRQNLKENKNNVSLFLGSGLKLNFNKDLPITPEASDWSSEDRMLSKTFYFSNARNMKYFVDKMIVEMEKMFHHCRFSVYHYEVTTTLQTETLNDISEQDIELSRFLDDLYFDIESNEK